jgi:spermidine synthase
VSEEQDNQNALRWTLLLLLSGAISLGYEALWIRRLGLILGGSAVAGAVVVGAFMAGLALGASLSHRVAGGASGPRNYALLEAFAAGWAVLFPALLWLGEPVALHLPGGRWALALALMLPPATALGATWPLLARAAGPGLATALYAANTTGAVFGVLTTTFVLMPTLGVRGSELFLAAAGFGIAVLATRLDTVPHRPTIASAEVRAPMEVLFAVAAAGFAALGLELVWMRLAAIGMGATVQTIGWVLAVFLAMVAAGAWLGRRWPADPRSGLSLSLGAMAALAIAGAAGWGQLPYLAAALYRWGGPEAMLPGSALMAAVAMAGAPAASGMAFSLAVRELGPELGERAGGLYAANTAGAIAGSFLGGLVAIPVLELRGAVLLFAGSAALAAVVVQRKIWHALPALVGMLLLPAWDAKLFAVGVHLRISDFADPSAAAVSAFVDEGWTLLYSDHGTTGAVAVGRGEANGNLWLSINGKVDASTGDDMPTQVLSGTLPVRIHGSANDVLVVGLASGITAGAVLKEPVQTLTVLELEPAVVAASRFFDAYSGAPLDDSRTTLVIDDARAFMQRSNQRYDVIISEPSNPWITGVSSLFTEEYWRLGQSRLTQGGVFCQWVQLYGMGPEEFRGVVRTFDHVFEDVWLFETIPGSDVLMIGGRDALPPGLPLQPTLDPTGASRLGGEGWLNTDDQPRVEWNAPRWLHYRTGPRNKELIEAARDPSATRP